MKRHLIAIQYLCTFAMFLFPVITSSAQNEIVLNTTPKGLSEKMIHNPAFVENAKGEDFCWHARVGMDDFVDNFRITGNKEWLDAGTTYYDFLISRMDTDPDGYKGWIGPYEYDGKYWQDALVGDAILMGGILNFCVVVMNNPALKKIYGRKANAYIEVAKKDFAEKWDKRGTWFEDSPFGSYIGFSKFINPANPKQWMSNNKVTRVGISHPFNKQLDAGEVFLRLYTVTGNKFYRDRAQEIFFTVKSHFQYFDNHYCWNYFDPLTPGDVDVEKNDTRHWVGVHPWRSGYQALDVEKIAEAYQYGIVFDEQDIKRIINTNLEVMWNKDKVHPKFINSNGLGADHDTAGLANFKAANGHSTAFKNEGQLWTGLLEFSQTVRDLYEQQIRENGTPTERLLYEKTILKDPPGFKRKYSKGELVIPVINFTESKDLYLATVLPHTISKGEKSIIICKSWNAGELQIDLYSIAGKKISNLYNGKIAEGYFTTTWDGKDPVKKVTYKGVYKIRWTINGGYREFPVVVK
ncbi:MAG: hypothetical protein ABI416_19130 [Ginsengibacter sp.]